MIKKHSAQKPTMIFCGTRQMCQGTAKMLVEYWSRGEHLWPAPGKSFSFRDRDLQSTAPQFASCSATHSRCVSLTKCGRYCALWRCFSSCWPRPKRSHSGRKIILRGFDIRYMLYLDSRGWNKYASIFSHIKKYGIRVISSYQLA